MSENNFSFRIWLRKGAEVFLEGGLGALVAWLTGLPSTPTVFAAIAILQLVLNYLKHR